MSFEYIIERLENSIIPEIKWRMDMTKDDKTYNIYEKQLHSVNNAIIQLKNYDSNVLNIKNLQDRIEKLENIINKNVNPLLKDFV